MPYFIYSGKINSDNYDSEYPRYTIKVVETEEQVIKNYKKFKKDITEEDNEVEFRVFEGKELKMKPIKVETDFTLE